MGTFYARLDDFGRIALICRFAGSLLLGGLIGLVVETFAEGASRSLILGWDHDMQQRLLFDLTALGALVLASYVLWRR